jgi:hypothetical protein
VDVLTLPETALTGYFLQGGVREQALTALSCYAAARVRATCGPQRPVRHLRRLLRARREQLF